MKKQFFMTLAVLGLTYSSWQVWNPLTKVLTVYLETDQAKTVYYSGDANGYVSRVPMKFSAGFVIPSFSDATSTTAK